MLYRKKLIQEQLILLSQMGYRLVCLKKREFYEF